MKRIVKVEQTLARLCAGVSAQKIREGFDGFDTESICAACGIARTNASKELNLLVEMGRAVKVHGRPVRYFCADRLRELFGTRPAGGTGRSLLALTAEEPAPEPARAEDFAVLARRPSLRSAIQQGKAAMMYPPNGLHTLLVGQSGVGKTFFAEAMFYFGVEKKLLAPDAQFVIFNCAEYADNPQLLLSQLFGHVRGAFTGADRSQPGIVDRADGGVLLLDEVHRLPPNGQEMLFTLIDKGYFRRLGQSGGPVSVNLRLICATTEDLESHMLTTFLRRIPMVISLPSLGEYSLEERFGLAERFFCQEADNMGVPVQVTRDVVEALVLYQPKGNIGQLCSDIQRLCARAYLEYKLHEEPGDSIRITGELLPDAVRGGLLDLKKKRDDLERIPAFRYAAVFTFQSGAGLRTAMDNLNTGPLYQKIHQLYRDYTGRNLGRDYIAGTIGRYIDEYMGGFLKEEGGADDDERLYKIVSPRVYSAAALAVAEAGGMLGRQYGRKVRVAFALHLSVLLERPVKRAHEAGDGEGMEQTAEHAAAMRMREIIERELCVKIPAEEAAFFASFLRLAEEKRPAGGYIGVVIIAHGKSTATSMAEVVNTLLKTNLCHGLDMELSESVEDCLERACRCAAKADQGRGVLLLVDMGSLAAFAEPITRRTGVRVRCMETVSTPIALEAVRKCLYREADLDTLVRDLIHNIPYAAGLSPALPEPDPVLPGGVVAVTCITGLGAARRLCEILRSNVRTIEQRGIELIPCDKDGGGLSPETAAHTLAVVGAVNLRLPGVPYIPTDEVIMGEGFSRLERLLEGGEPEDSGGRLGLPVPNYVVSRLLTQYLTFLDPVKANTVVSESFSVISSRLGLRDTARVKLRYLLHNCCLIERVISGQTLGYSNLEAFREEKKELFSLVREALGQIEQAFSISIPDTEAAYVVELIDTD